MFASALIGQTVVTPVAPAYVARGDGYSVLLRPDGAAVYELPEATIRVELAGHNPAIRITSERRTVRLNAVYPGIDMLWRTRGRDLEYEFPIAAGADPSRIQLRFTGARSANLERDGNLVLETAAGRLSHRHPIAWQEIGGRRIAVPARFRLAHHTVAFELGRYDHRQPLWIDPVLSYSSYLGGAGFDAGNAIALDTSGNIYITGTTASVDFPSSNPMVNPYRAVFVTKLNPSGSVIYTTTLSGTGDSYGQAIAVDPSGNAYIAGYTEAPDFPTTPGAWQAISGGSIDAFIAKLDPNGNVVYATYAGGPGNDYGTGIAVDHSGNAYVSGYTASMNFPTTVGAAQPVNHGGAYDAFVLKLNAAGNTAVYSTLLGGSGTDMAQSIVLYATGNVCVAGYTSSTDLPVVAALQPSYGGEGDALIACLNASGTAWTTVSYLGGSGMDQAYDLARDAAGNLYMAGTSFSIDFPTSAGAFQPAVAGSYDAFAVKLYPNAIGVVYSTLLGGSGSDAATAIAVASAGDIWLGGYTNSMNFPLAAPWQPTIQGGFDGFLAHLSADGTTLLGSSYLGGAGDDQIWNMVLSPAGQLFVTGSTASTNFPITPSATQATAPSDENAFIALINPVMAGYSISGQVTGAAGTPLGGVTITLSGSAGATATTDANGDYNFSGLLAGSYTVTPSGAGYAFTPPSQTFTSMSSNQTANFTATLLTVQLQSDVMSESTPTGYGCPLPPPAASFAPTDAQAVVWFLVNNANIGDQAVANWYTPSGTLYASYSFSPVASPGSICLWTSINIAGNPPASQPGVWTVSVTWNSAPLFTLPFSIQSASTALLFVPVTPCRVVDTRSPDGPFGGPELADDSRDFTIPDSSCGIPATAVAYSLNVTVVPSGVLSYLTIWPTGQTRPVVSTLNSLNGIIKADAAIVPAGTNGSVSVYASGATNVVLDINGYFIAGDPYALAFYPMTPCRVVDTRRAAGALGGPSMAGGETRTLPLPDGCGIPAAAQAYSLNITVVPSGPLSYLTTWPAGAAKPVASTLNAPSGLITANAAIVPAGTSGAINVFTSNTTEVVVDINGYFAPPATSGLSFYPVPPCRVVDTRNPDGSLGGPLLSGERSFPVSASPCSLPPTAQAYSLNATVVPVVTLGYLTLWPDGSPKPVASTLNSPNGSIDSNAAIVPTSDGSICAFSSDGTALVLDANGYFAP